MKERAALARECNCAAGVRSVIVKITGRALGCSGERRADGKKNARKERLQSSHECKFMHVRHEFLINYVYRLRRTAATAARQGDNSRNPKRKTRRNTNRTQLHTGMERTANVETSVRDNRFSIPVSPPRSELSRNLLPFHARPERSAHCACAYAPHTRPDCE